MFCVELTGKEYVQGTCWGAPAPLAPLQVEARMTASGTAITSVTAMKAVALLALLQCVH